MNYKEQYKLHMQDFENLKKSGTAHLWIDQAKRYVKPFRIFGNLYYVGDNDICMHLIDTGDGLLLCDAGNYGSEGMLVNAIWEAGFNPYDIKWLILSHGHMDHIGCAEFFRTMYGCKIYLGEPDARMFRDQPELSLVGTTPSCAYQLFEPDVMIKDGDVLTFGNTTVEFYLVPGHTQGCIAYFFDVTDGIVKKRAGYYGGFGFNTLTREYLIQAGDPELKSRKIYQESLAKVRNQHVDIFMGNHTVNNQLLERRKRMLEDPDKNPFIDDKLWGEYLDKKLEELLKFCEEN